MSPHSLDFVGNAERGAVEAHEITEIDGQLVALASWADTLRAQGIRWIEGDPAATQELSVAELKARNQVGITLVYPEPE